MDDTPTTVSDDVSTPTDAEDNVEKNGPEGEDAVPIRRTVNLMGAVAMIVGSIVGSGIYISPKGVIENTGSVGLNLILWALCGLIAMGGAFCFAELGTLVRESGGQWAYIRAGLGDAPAFVSAWMNIMLSSVTSSVISLSSGNYVLTNFTRRGCQVPESAVKLVGLLILWMALYINTSVKLASRVLKALLFMKVLSLVLIVAGGVYWMAAKGTNNLKDPFKGTTKDAWSVATAFYSGLFAYDGWETLNYVTEEIKDLKRTMPRAIVGSTLLVILLYLLVNVSYYLVLTPAEVMGSSAVAIDWGGRIVGDWSQLFSVVVALSIFGSVVASLFGLSRVLMAVARAGHTVELLSMVSVRDNSPTMSILLRGLVATVITFIGDISSLIDFFSFCAWMFYGMCFISLIVLKLKKYNADDPDVFRVPIILPFVMTAIALYLTVFPIIANPSLTFLYAGLFMVSGLIFYFPFVYCKVRLVCFNKVTMWMQLFFRVSIPEKVA